MLSRDDLDDEEDETPIPSNQLLKQVELRVKSLLNDEIYPVINALDERIKASSTDFAAKISEILDKIDSNSTETHQFITDKLSEQSQNLKVELNAYTGTQISCLD